MKSYEIKIIVTTDADHQRMVEIASDMLTQIETIEDEGFKVDGRGVATHEIPLVKFKPWN